MAETVVPAIAPPLLPTLSPPLALSPVPPSKPKILPEDIHLNLH
ncbi:MAG: hypothetical protein ACR5KV_06775 [Wolbachia sp.]